MCEPPRPDGALAQVRAKTSTAHQGLEARLDVLHKPWDLQVHRQWLSLTWGLFAPLERQLAAWAGVDAAALDVGERARADLALADLRVLGADDDDLAALRQCPDVPQCTSRPAALGVCYVLDGSTLGGRLITQTVVAAGVPPQACTSLTGRPGAGRRWRQTIAAVDAVAQDAIEDMTAAAIATFGAYEQWLAPLDAQRGPAASPPRATEGTGNPG